MPHLGSYRDQEPLGSGHYAPVGTREDPMGVGESLSHQTLCNRPFCGPLTPFILLLPPLFCSIPPLHPPPPPPPGTKGVIGLEKAELTGILNDDTL